MITLRLILTHSVAKWAENVCDTYDLDMESLIFQAVEYCGKDVVKSLTEDDYARYNTFTSPYYMTVMFTETLYNMVQQLAKGTLFSISYIVNGCLKYVKDNFEDFERWYDEKLRKEVKENENAD